MGRKAFVAASVAAAFLLAACSSGSQGVHRVHAFARARDFANSFGQVSKIEMVKADGKAVTAAFRLGYDPQSGLEYDRPSGKVWVVRATGRFTDCDATGKSKPCSSFTLVYPANGGGALYLPDEPRARFDALGPATTYR